MPGTRTPQPILSAEAWATLVLGWAWAAYLFSRRGSVSAGHRAIRIFAATATGLAALALVVYAIGGQLPFWPKVENGNFGFFPNRNQTANFLMLAGVMSAAIALEAWRSSPVKALLWLGAVGLHATALVLTNSRAGLLLFSGGLVALAICAGTVFRIKDVLKLMVILLSVVAVGVLVFGGRLLDRLAGDGGNGRQEFRPIIHADALKLSYQWPCLGVGLSNFEAAFRWDRDASRSANYAQHPDEDWAWQIRTLHPESDWLWVATEMGWGAPILLSVAVLVWLRRCFPFPNGSRRITRAAALIGGVCFLIHGFQDVSGHRLGTIWAALFVMSTAVSPSVALPEARSGFYFFKVLGGLCVVLGAVGLVAGSGSPILPSQERLRFLRIEVDQAAAAGQSDRVEAAASAALSMAPLEWSFYYQRAVFRALSGRTPEALGDFRAVRLLERARVQECLHEGILWLTLGHSEYTLEAWREAVRRSPDGGLGVFQWMVNQSSEQPAARCPLETLAQDTPLLAVTWLESSSRDDFTRLVHDWTQRDPGLRQLEPAQRQAVLKLWKAKGDLRELRRFLLEYPPFGIKNSAPSR